MAEILRKTEGMYLHWCPACEHFHPLPFDGWTFNDDMKNPTFTPSFAQGKGRVCHYKITNGTIEFIRDSWHGRSDIVAMPSIPKNLPEE